MPPSGLYRQCMHVVHRHNMQAQHIHIINNLNLFLSQHFGKGAPEETSLGCTGLGWKE